MSRGFLSGPWALVAFAVAGIAASTYLTAAHFAGVQPVCATGGVVDCGAVTSSVYSVIPGTSIPVTLLGLAWFGVSGALALAATPLARRAVQEPRWLRAAHVAWAAAGITVVLYLVFGEISLRRICEWCTFVHVLVLASLLVALARWQRA